MFSVNLSGNNLADIAYTLEANRAGFPVQLVTSASALAHSNDSASYWSWADPRLGWRELLRGFGNPKVWWYLPGVAWFQVRLFGWRGVAALGWLVVKLAVLLPFKLVTGRQNASLEA